MSALRVDDVLRVLVVDDESSAAEQLANQLRDDFEVEALVRVDGYQGLDVLVNEHVDVAFVDMFMPGATGIQVLERLRSKGCETPVVIMNELVTPDLVQQVERYSKAFLIEKPVDAVTLEALLATLPRCPRPNRRGHLLRPSGRELPALDLHSVRLGFGLVDRNANLEDAVFVGGSDVLLSRSSR